MLFFSNKVDSFLRSLSKRGRIRIIENVYEFVRKIVLNTKAEMVKNIDYDKLPIKKRL